MDEIKKTKERINLKDFFITIFNKTTLKEKISLFIPFFITVLTVLSIDNLNNYQIYSILFINIFLIISSLQDYYEKAVYDFFLLPISLFSIFYIGDKWVNEDSFWFHFLSGIFTNIILGLFIISIIWFSAKVIENIKGKQALGEGDYYIFFAFPIIGGLNTTAGLIFTSLLSIIYILVLKNIEKKKSIDIPEIEFEKNNFKNLKEEYKYKSKKFQLHYEKNGFVKDEVDSNDSLLAMKNENRMIYIGIYKDKVIIENDIEVQIPLIPFLYFGITFMFLLNSLNITLI